MRKRYFKGDIIEVLNSGHTMSINTNNEASSIDVQQGNRLYVVDFEPQNVSMRSWHPSFVEECKIWALGDFNDVIGFGARHIVLHKRPFINWIKCIFA